jgi:hypothetical protein
MKPKPCGNPDSINLLLHATQEDLTRQSTITPAWLARGRPILIGGQWALLTNYGQAMDRGSRSKATS